MTDTYRANNFGDLSALSIRLCSLPSWVALGAVHDLGLMKMPPPWGVMLWLIRKLRGSQGVTNFFWHMSQRSPDQVNAWVAQMLQHLHFGKDTEDSDSLGGWSQREINLLAERIARP